MRSKERQGLEHAVDNWDDWDVTSVVVVDDLLVGSGVHFAKSNLKTWR